MLNETFEQRLSWLDKDHYEFSNSRIAIIEKDENAKAEIEVILDAENISSLPECEINLLFEMFDLEYPMNYLFPPNPNYALKMKFDTNQMRLHYLRQRKVADAVIFEFLEAEQVILHIIECKRTIKVSVWEQIKKQFEGAVLNSLGILGVLGLSDANIRNIIFYTVYQFNRFTSDILRTGHGAVSPVKDWIEGKVSILSLASATHKEIKSDTGGKGRIFLTKNKQEMN